MGPDYSELSIVVLDYGSGNVRSVMHALKRAGANPQLSGDLELALNCDGLLVPGVGAYASVVGLLRAKGADQVIAQRFENKRHILGICVGLQVMFEGGTEHNGGVGLGYFKGKAERLRAAIVPHMGWSQVKAANGTRLLRGLDGERFYFLHSYAVDTDTRCISGCESPGALVSVANHGHPFVAAIECGPLTATQFHPEKSGAAGVGLLRNWLEMIACDEGKIE